MARHTIDVNALTPGKCVLVRGKVSYSRMNSWIEGDELDRINLANKNRGIMPDDKRYAKVTIAEAQVMRADPANPSLEEQYCEEMLFTTQKGTGYSFEGKDKGNRLPWLGQRRADVPTIIDELIPQGELAQGLDVCLVMKVYKAKAFGRNGIGLDGVIVNEPVQYYQGTANGLNQLGLTFNAAPKSANEEVAKEAPAVAPAPAPAPQANPYAVQQPATPAPAPAAAPAPYGYGPAPTSTPIDGGNAGGGIRYNPAENRGY